MQNKQTTLLLRLHISALPLSVGPVNPASAPHSHFAGGMSRKTTYMCQEGVSTKTQNKMTPQQRISPRCLTKGKHRLNIRRNFLRLRCIKLWDHLPRGAVGTMKPAT